MLQELQKDAVLEFAIYSFLKFRSSKHPIGSMTSSEDDRNQYLAAKYKERIEAMLDRQQVCFSW